MAEDKDPRRVEAGKKAAETRKEREGDQVFSEMGKKGAEARQSMSSGSSSESGSYGSSGSDEYEGKDPRRVEAGKKAAETRKEREGEDVFHKLGEKGSEARWGHGSNQQQEREE